MLIPGGGGIRGSASTAGGFVASDGRILYPATRSNTTNSYFPTPFERTLFEIFINDLMFGIGQKCTVLFSLALQLVNATSRAQWIIVIEKGTAPSDTLGSPNTAELNLQNIVWDTVNPILRQQLILTSSQETHTFGCILTNNTTGITANALLYSQVRNANSGAPASADFALRARLIDFDTEDNAPTARGWVSYNFLAPASGTFGAVIA